HLYMSGLLRLGFRLRRGLRDLPLERGRHDRPVGPAGEDVAASAARPDARRFPADRDRGAPWTGVPHFQALLDFLDAAADSHTVGGAETADDACLSRATGHGGSQEDCRSGRMSRPTRWAVTIIRFTSS